MKRKYIIIIASIILVIAFGIVIFRIVDNKETVNNEDGNATVLLMIGTLEPDNSKSFIFLDNKDNIVLIKGITGINGQFNTTSSKNINNKKYKEITKQLKKATRCEEPSYDCYLVAFKGEESYFVKQSDVDLKY